MNRLLAAAATTMPSTTELARQWREVEEGAPAEPSYVLTFLLFVPVLALAYSLCVKLLGLVWDRFETSGGGFGALYGKMLIAAGAFVLLTFVPYLPIVLFVIVMGAVYKWLFGAGFVEAVIIGVLGLVLALLLMTGFAAVLGGA
jgi:hypothetical protein